MYLYSGAFKAYSTDNLPVFSPFEGLEKIAEGGHREIFRLSDVAIKSVKPRIKKSYAGVEISIPSWLAALIHARVSDFNSQELANYKTILNQVPINLRDSFMQVYGISTHNGNNVLRTELIVDNNGQLSRPLREHGPVLDNSFWERLNALESLFINRDLRFFDITDKNILVRNNGDSKLPVFTDYDRLGILAYGPQLNLLVKSEREAKIRRRFQRLKSKYKINTPSRTSQAHQLYQSP